MRRSLAVLLVLVVLVTLSACDSDPAEYEPVSAPTSPPWKEFESIHEDGPLVYPDIELPEVPNPVPVDEGEPLPEYITDPQYPEPSYSEVEIYDVSATVIDDWLGDDELSVCVRFWNPGTSKGEYRVYLYDEDGDFIDKEPDDSWVILEAGVSGRTCVGTNYIWPSLEDMGDTYTVVVHMNGYSSDYDDSYTGNVP